MIEYGDKVYDRIQRRVNAILRNYRQALKDLESLPVASEEPERNEQPIPEIGFVPEKSADGVAQVAPAPPPAPAVVEQIVESALPPASSTSGKVYRDLWTPRQPGSSR